MIVRRNLTEFDLGSSGFPTTASTVRFGSRKEALSMLLAFEFHEMDFRRLRQVLAEVDFGMRLSQIPDARLLPIAADILYMGRLHLAPCRETTRGAPRSEPRSEPAVLPALRQRRLVELYIRLNVDPNEASSVDDRFVLKSSRGGYRQEKTVKDDRTPGDRYVDLRFTGLSEDQNYTLEIWLTPEGPPVYGFRDVPYPDLFDLGEAPSREGT